MINWIKNKSKNKPKSQGKQKGGSKRDVDVCSNYNVINPIRHINIIYSLLKKKLLNKILWGNNRIMNMRILKKQDFLCRPIVYLNIREFLDIDLSPS